MAYREGNWVWYSCDCCGRESGLFRSPEEADRSLTADGWELAPGLDRCPGCNERGDLPAEYDVRVIEVKRASS